MPLEPDLYAEDVRRMTDHQRHARGAALADRELFADDVRRMNEQQRRRLRARRKEREGRGPSLAPWAALALVGGAVALSALVLRRWT